MANDIEVVEEPTQVEINGKRFYRVNFSDGSFRLLRSVTTIIKSAKLPSFLDEWQMQQVEALGVAGYKAALQQTADDGTAVHKLIEHHIKGTEYDIQDEDQKRLYENYLRWEEKNPGLEELWSEKALYSLKHGYAGRADRKVIHPKYGKTIIDYKSAKAVRPDHKEQGVAYLMADAEMNPKEGADAILVLALGAETKQGFSECWITDPADITNYFMSFHLRNQLVSFHN